MAEPHDRCDLDGCTLGRAHVGPCSGPRCPACKASSVFNVNGWYCPARYRSCLHEAPIPVPVEPARQPMPAASPLASGMRLPNEPSDVDQLMLDIEAEARECDEDARSKQRRAAELRAMLAYLRAWRSKAAR